MADEYVGEMVQITRPAGPTLVLGDCLAPVLILRKDDDGQVYSACPTCGDPVTDSTSRHGGTHRMQIGPDGVAYGPGICVPCGHPIGAIDIEGEAERAG